MNRAFILGLGLALLATPLSAANRKPIVIGPIGQQQQIQSGDVLVDSTGTAYSTSAGSVSTTGSPVSGNLTTFSGTTTITNGDLSGDCSTSGTLTLTCPNEVKSNQNNTFTKAQRGTPIAVTISTATFTPNFDNAQNFVMTLVHASCPCTIANPGTTPVAGQTGIIEVIQSATGSDTIGTWGSQWVAAGGTSTLTQSTAANAQDYYSYYVIDATHILVSSGALNAVH